MSSNAHALFRGLDFILRKRLKIHVLGLVVFTFYRSDACDVTLNAYPRRTSLKNMPGHGGNRTYDLWNTSPLPCQLSYAVRWVRICSVSYVMFQRSLVRFPPWPGIFFKFALCGYTFRVTSQASDSPECITPTQAFSF